MLDIQYAAIFYLVFSIFGIPAFYLLVKVLPKTNRIVLYSIAKPLGLILFAYPIWILSSLKLLKFNQNEILLLLFGLLVFGSIGILGWELKKRLDNNAFNKKNLLKFAGNLAMVEIGTIVLYSIYLFIRAFNPNLEGTEKFMDILMLSSAGKTEYFPFFDAWWAGKDVNYYYYGFYLFALIANISQVPYSYAYNLALGIIFSQAFVISFAIVFRFSKNHLNAFFGACLVNLSGNFHYTYCLASNYNKDLRMNCFYPKASRILDPAYTINEFPTYSYILGDLHPHVLSLPFFILGLYLIVEIFKEKKFNIWLHLIFGFVIAAAGLINFWDFMTLGAIYGIIFIFKLSRKLFIKRKEIKSFIAKNKMKLGLKISTALLLAMSPFLLYIPFFLHFKSPVAGIGFAPEFVKYHSSSFPNMQYPSSETFQLGMWGFFLLLILPSIAVFVSLSFRQSKELRKMTLPMILFLSSILLIVFTELFFFKDLFHIANPPYFRANTVFKFTYHAWILMGISSAMFLWLAWKSLGKIKALGIGISADIAYFLVVSVIFTLSFSYAHFGFSQAYGFDTVDITKKLSEKTKDGSYTLDGTKYVSFRNTGDYETIKWLNENQKERVVILEAVGGAYTYFARIGVNTGMGNIINWETHQWTWRFKYPDGVKDWKEVTEKKSDTGYSAIAATTQEVRTVYQTEDIEEARSILKKYNVKYVYVGDSERSTYAVREEKFSELGKVVFRSERSVLYEIDGR